jgi:hypothetical protein
MGVRSRQAGITEASLTRRLGKKLVLVIAGVAAMAVELAVLAASSAPAASAPPSSPL